MATITRSSLPEQVFAGLVADVVSGRYAPGDRLPPQRTLADQLGVNMASLREGIGRLEQLRLIDVRHGDAMRVRDWRTGGLGVLAYAAAADPALVDSLFEARTLLLSEAARLAADRRGDDQASALVALAEQFADAADDASAQAIDLAFFEVVIAASANLVFRLILNSIAELYAESADAYVAIVSRRHELVPLYRSAAAAIAAGDAALAAGGVRELAAAQQARMLRR